MRGVIKLLDYRHFACSLLNGFIIPKIFIRRKEKNACERSSHRIYIRRSVAAVCPCLNALDLPVYDAHVVCKLRRTKIVNPDNGLLRVWPEHFLGFPAFFPDAVFGIAGRNNATIAPHGRRIVEGHHIWLSDKYQNETI